MRWWITAVAARYKRDAWLDPETVRPLRARRMTKSLSRRWHSKLWLTRLSPVDIYSRVLRQLKSGESVMNSRTQRHERIGRLLKMHANKREDIQEILAGDICAVVGLKNVSTGDTICNEQHPITLESITFAVPVIAVAVEPKTKADQEKMAWRWLSCAGRSHF